MTGRTHASCGLMLGVFLAKDYGVSIEGLFVVSSAVAGSLIPDICHTKSYIGRRVPVISHIVRFIFGHRAFTHSLLFLALNYIILHMTGIPDLILMSYIFGMVSHLILDIMTRSGIALFYPFKKRVKVEAGVKTGGALDFVLFFVFVGAALYGFIYSW